jgi:hypothetical protein
MIALALLVLLAAVVAARYLRSDKSEQGQASAQEFYFTTDLLGDSYMVNENGAAGAGDSFAFPSVQSGTFYLYGGGKHAITIQVQNFSDAQRITAQSISYTASVTVETPSGGSASYTAQDVSLTKDGSSCTGGTLKQNKGALEQVSDALVLSIPDCQTTAYDDGTVVTVTLTSTAPYEKTIELRFVLYSVDTALRYEVNDSVGSPYAELVIMTNAKTDVAVQPYLQWSSALSIDNTNVLTYTYNNGTFTQMDGIEDRKMQISRELNSGESVSIYFFKSNTSESYSLSARSVAPASDGSYTITVEKAAVTTTQ